MLPPVTKTLGNVAKPDIDALLNCDVPLAMLTLPKNVVAVTLPPLFPALSAYELIVNDTEPF